MRDTIDMAREAGFVFGLIEPVVMVRYIPQDGFERFAELVRADAIATEREACAKVCDDLAVDAYNNHDILYEQCADAIRARGNT
jgi:hypothetical protein